MKYTWIMGGGCGDCLREFYWSGYYAALDELWPEDSCDIHIFSHNPFVEEFFRWHPKADRLNVKSWGYIVPDEEEVKRREFGVPLEGTYAPLPHSPKPVVFYPSPEDQHWLSEIKNCQRWFGTLERDAPVVVLAPGAGTPDRNLPDLVKEKFFQERLRSHDKFITVSTGRQFERQNRAEPFWGAEFMAQGILSLPGTCKLLEGAAGLVTCHSALSMLAWCIKKPQLLLYPQSVKERHFLFPDMWSWGATNGLTVHATFDEFSLRPQEYTDQFLSILKEGDK